MEHVILKSTSSNPIFVGCGIHFANMKYRSSCEEKRFMCSRLSQSRDALRSREVMFSQLLCAGAAARLLVTAATLSQGCSLLFFHCDSWGSPDASLLCWTVLWRAVITSTTTRPRVRHERARGSARRYPSMSIH